MKLIEVRKVEDCFDGGLKLEYRFDGEIAEPFMRHLAVGSRLDYFPIFPSLSLRFSGMMACRSRVLSAVPISSYISPAYKKRK